MDRLQSHLAPLSLRGGGPSSSTAAAAPPIPQHGPAWPSIAPPWKSTKTAETNRGHRASQWARHVPARQPAVLRSRKSDFHDRSPAFLFFLLLFLFLPLLQPFNSFASHSSSPVVFAVPCPCCRGTPTLQPWRLPLSTRCARRKRLVRFAPLSLPQCLAHHMLTNRQHKQSPESHTSPPTSSSLSSPRSPPTLNSPPISSDMLPARTAVLSLPALALSRM